MEKSCFKMSRLSRAVSLGLATAVVGMASASAAENVRVIVAYKSGVNAALQAETAVLAARGQVKLKIAGTRAMAVEVPVNAVAALRNNPNVEYVEEDLRRRTMALSSPSTGNPYLSGQKVPYGIKQVQADLLAGADSLTSNRKVCIIDSGYNRDHEDLTGNTVAGEFDNNTRWWYTDENGHGTHVAGTIAAVNNSGKGVVGVNPNKRLRLHIVKVFDADGWAYSSTLITAANKCKTMGANVISMSLGGAGRSLSEERAFDKLHVGGILLVAAAGNDGDTSLSYPASYPSVMSVAAVDENKAWAPFSQYNKQVSIAGPGVDVLSTVPMGTGSESVLSVADTAYAANEMTGTPKITATAALADFGLGDKVDAAVAGKICLIARGSVSFAVKVGNCQTSGGLGAIVYNNAPGSFNGTLGGAVTTIPSVSTTDVDGAALKAKLGQSTTVGVAVTNYGTMSGTSMATPHVAAVAALVWSYFPHCTAAKVRSSLERSALDLGTAGRDDKYGHGLVQAKAAYDRINNKGCGN